MIGADALFLPLCMIAAVVLRYGSVEPALDKALGAQIVFALLSLPVLGAAGLYRSVVRYMDLLVVWVSCLSLAIVVVLVFTLANVLDYRAVPRSSVLIFWFTASLYVILSRFFARAILRQAMRFDGRPRIRMAIYGAGSAGVQLSLSMKFSPEYKAVCFFDDRAELFGKTVAGMKVYSPAAFAEALRRLDVQQIVVAIPSMAAAERRRLITRLEGTGLPVKMLPGLVDLVSGQVRVSDIREVDVMDLLGRESVPPDHGLLARNIEGKCVLVTGAGGSIGSELCRQILTQGPARLVLLDHSEYLLYSIDQELQQMAQAEQVQAVLGSVLDEVLLRETIRRHGIQTVYHAAAYKHVPLVEANLREGLRNNVIGTLNVARAAADGDVEMCILISTDKAVRPTNVMGASKRASELIFQAAAQRVGARTCFAMVRFGNVLGSSGSVVPLFRRQIREGGPITITHPDIIRYFMLIPEAVQLVIQAGAMAKGGEVFVLDMGEPVKIIDLARTMIRLSGLTEKTADRPMGEIEIQCVGLRPGEKLFEELLIGEGAAFSEHPRILRAHERFIEPIALDAMLSALRLASDRGSARAMLAELQRMVPEYSLSAEMTALNSGFVQIPVELNITGTYG
ncbi:polysaccharide biosynthesis protein [Roseateles oligotrophus]|uniref:Polysaccharide biosynthesis protein n=1 Tax=Roseateles oligotrophus TaxID=1769250 RepID=A0ABT2YDW2_9BURK|nr:nucleoside-diphosphate sugar epimerase/dehydratase [Roseateles oligotrophus]MCV2368243.1 polysaccharide biosynthesis protein [Roseateles oligotrophus]